MTWRSVLGPTGCALVLFLLFPPFAAVRQSERLRRRRDAGIDVEILPAEVSAQTTERPSPSSVQASPATHRRRNNRARQQARRERVARQLDLDEEAAGQQGALAAPYAGAPQGTRCSMPPQPPRPTRQPAGQQRRAGARPPPTPHMQPAGQQSAGPAPSAIATATAAAPAEVACKGAARQPIDDEATVRLFDFGSRSRTCKHCNATLWPGEITRTAMCCSGGAALSMLNAFPTPAPPLLRDLLTTYPPTAEGKKLKANIRAYNNALSFASSGISALTANPRGGISMLAIRGAPYHLLGPMSPAPGAAPHFGQLYIIDDAQQQLEARLRATAGNGGGGDAGHGINNALDPVLLGKLQAMMLECNPYVQIYRQVRSPLCSLPVGPPRRRSQPSPSPPPSLSLADQGHPRG